MRSSEPGKVKLFVACVRIERRSATALNRVREVELCRKPDGANGCWASDRSETALCNQALRTLAWKPIFDGDYAIRPTIAYRPGRSAHQANQQSATVHSPATSVTG